MSAVATFGTWQRSYADRGIPTFPVGIEGSDKRPKVKNYLRIGQNYSRQLADRFPTADAFGFALGARSRITVLDIDTPDERVLADALSRHGHTPLIVRSGGGNHQAWYRHNGERRQIRPERGLPIDILGAGYVVAPPSRGARGSYEIIQGSLDDLDRLPKLANLPARGPVGGARKVLVGERNTSLWEHCMRQAKSCDDFDALLDVAETFNESALVEPLPADEVVKVAQSAWEKTVRGENRFGQHGAFMTVQEADELASDPYLFALLTWLRAHNGPDATFMVADGLAGILKWSRRRFSESRARAIGPWIKLVRPRSPGKAALYQWASGSDLPVSVGHEIGGGEVVSRRVLVEDYLPVSVGLPPDGRQRS